MYHINPNTVSYHLSVFSSSLSFKQPRMYSFLFHWLTQTLIRPSGDYYKQYWYSTWLRCQHISSCLCEMMTMSLPKPPAREHLTRKPLQYLIYQEGKRRGGSSEAERKKVVSGREACNLKAIKWKVNWKEKLKEASGNCKKGYAKRNGWKQRRWKEREFLQSLESLRMQNRG